MNCFEFVARNFLRICENVCYELIMQFPGMGFNNFSPYFTSLHVDHSWNLCMQDFLVLLVWSHLYQASDIRSDHVYTLHGRYANLYIQLSGRIHSEIREVPFNCKQHNSNNLSKYQGSITIWVERRTTQQIFF